MPPTKSYGRPIPPALTGNKDGCKKMNSLKSYDGPGAGAGAGAGAPRTLTQQVELARRKIADAARNFIGPLRNEDYDAAVNDNLSASADAADVMVSSSSLTSVPETTTDEIKDTTNYHQQVEGPSISIPQHQFQRIIASNDDTRDQSSRIIIAMLSVVIVGISVILQISSKSSSNVLIAAFYFVLGCSADRMLQFFVFHQRPRRKYNTGVTVVNAATQTSKLSSESVFDASGTHVSFSDDKIIGSTSQNENNRNIPASHYLERTKQILSQHKLLLGVGGKSSMHVRRYSNLLHTPSVDGTTPHCHPSSSAMVAMLTGKIKKGGEDDDDDDDAAIREWKRRMRAPFSDAPLMDHLLSYSDFRRLKKSTKEAMAKVVRAPSIRHESKVTVEDEDVDINWEDEREEEGEEEEEEGLGVRPTSGNNLVGMAKLNNIRASRVFTHVVDPLCCLRGMDLFVTDAPEEDIWRQPMLNECGLRDVPTFIANMMLPFGNLTAYFTLPDWFDDWDNIPSEKHDDPPDIKAFKRFLSGDLEYQARAKIIPCIVDGPLAIRMIRPPKPKEVLIHTPRHPAMWTRVPKSVDPTTGKTNCAILECDVDFVSDKSIRKLINIVRPYVQSITIDMAFIISKPENSSIDEPCACLGLWRIDQVDFESCAVFPERTIDEVAEEMKLIMSVMEEQRK